LNSSYRKPNVPKIMVLNGDDTNFELLNEIPADRKWSYSLQKSSEVRGENLELRPNGSTFKVELPNYKLNIDTPIVGRHNIMNVLAAIATVAANQVEVNKIEKLLKKFPGIPGRLEPVNEGQNFSVVVDFSYKPSGLEAVLQTLQEMVKGRVICVWGGVGRRNLDEDYYKESAKIIHQYADEIILTTDDPYEDNPKKIAQIIRKHLPRTEGENFFEIEDRYEAIRYGIFTAEEHDCVILAGRGHENQQCIGNATIDFDDRIIAREILQFAKKKKLLALEKK